MRRASLGAAIGLALAACAPGPYRLDAPRGAAGIELAPYAIYEDCVELETGKRIDYYFSSVARVAFNIHYHESNAVIIPVTRSGVKEGGGEFSADHAAIYCLMWEAGAEPSLLEYRIRPLPERH
jgi:hypothetical protein